MDGGAHLEFKRQRAREKQYRRRRGPGHLVFVQLCFLAESALRSVARPSTPGGAQCTVHGERAAGAHVEEKVFSLSRRVIAV